MCKNLTVWWEDLDGNRLKEIAPVVYESPAAFTAEQPTCTCWIGDEDDEEGKRLRKHFVETTLRPMLDMPFVGRIVIEVL